jgi:AMP-binding enzyme
VVATVLRGSAESGCAVAFARELAQFGSAPALISTAGEWSYSDLAGRVEHWREFLGPRRRLVLVELEPEPELVAIYLAALSGGHPVLVVAGDQPGFTDELIETYAPELVFGNGRPGLAQQLPGRGPQLHPDLALLLSTSGSTGSPKLVRLSAEGVGSNAIAIAEALGLRPDDRTITSLPLHYCYGLSVLNSHLSVGASVVLTRDSVVTDEFWASARRHAVTTLAAVPYTFDVLDRYGSPGELVPALRLVTQAGGRLSADRVRHYAAIGAQQGWQLAVMYGQTEATARMTVLDPAQTLAKPECVGLPISGGRVRVRALPDRPDLPPGIGELVYAGPNVMMGYAQRQGDLARGPECRYLATGDLARIDASGNVHILGRVSRSAKVAGLRIDLDRVEGRLAESGLSALCAQPADRDHLVLLTTCPDLDQVLREAVEVTRLPSHYLTTVHCAALPLLGNGKPDYAAVAAEAKSARHADAALVGSTRSALLAAYAQVLGRAEVLPSDSFVGLGGDSLSHVEMSVRLESLIGAVPRDWPTRTIAELADGSTGAALPARRLHWPRVEISVLIKALAIILIVGSHSDVFTLMGGAHVLVALVGFNFARFVLAAEDPRTRLQQSAKLIARLVIPAMAWTAAVLMLTGQYTWANVFLLNSLIGDPGWGPHWHLWFVEAVVYPLVLATLLLAAPAVRRVERRYPFGLPTALTAAALLVPLGLIPTPDSPGLRFLWFGVAWLFLGGWAAARAVGPKQRLTVTALLMLGVPGFFDTTSRSLILGIGLGLLVWCPGLPWPRRLLRPTGWIASSSLVIYLTHWQIYPHLEQDYPLAGLLLSLLAGVLAWQVMRAVESRLFRLVPPAGLSILEPRKETLR